jgi:transcriptional regulator EpsA
MQPVEATMIEQHDLPRPRDHDPSGIDDEVNGHPTFLEPLELEALALNLDASLRVYALHHFFCWTQGLFQNLIKHELLICALRKGESMSFSVDSFSTAPPNHEFSKDLSGQNTLLMPHLVRLWEANHFRPVLVEFGSERLAAGSELARELNFIGGNDILVHGTYDTAGTPSSLFIFVCRPGAATAKHAHLLELITPSLHSAWVRTQVNWPDASGATRPPAGGRELLTAREKEILQLVYLGKSNIEIGMILGISSLTVKNHVQKILRRLNVQNRTQAVGRALSLRILGE